MKIEKSVLEEIRSEARINLPKQSKRASKAKDEAPLRPGEIRSLQEVLACNDGKIVLHSCCAPCEGPLLEQLLAWGVRPIVLYYNPNIHPYDEYEQRKQESKKQVESLGLTFVDADYDAARWMGMMTGLENEPERGLRCSKCFDMRFLETALYSKEQGIAVFTSSLGISRWKDMEQINNSGLRASSLVPGVYYWTYNWRLNGGSQRMYEIAKEKGFYKQEYCGCVYSLRATNAWRTQQGRAKIAIGQEYYAYDKEDEAK